MGSGLSEAELYVIKSSADEGYRDLAIVGRVPRVELTVASLP